MLGTSPGPSTRRADTTQIPAVLSACDLIRPPAGSHDGCPENSERSVEEHHGRGVGKERERERERERWRERKDALAALGRGRILEKEVREPCAHADMRHSELLWLKSPRKRAKGRPQSTRRASPVTPPPQRKSRRLEEERSGLG